MKYRLTITPALGRNYTISKTFSNYNVMFEARDLCADMLIFLQDEMKVMDDAANMFICEVFSNGEWQEMDND